MKVEHLSEADKKLVDEAKTGTNDTVEPKKKKFKVSRVLYYHVELIARLNFSFRVKTVSI